MSVFWKWEQGPLVGEQDTKENEREYEPWQVTNLRLHKVGILR